MKLINLLLVWLFVGWGSIAAAQKTVSGKIFDKNTREPLSGATVLVPGTHTGTISDHQGAFTISSIKETDSIQISLVGYATQTFLPTGSGIQLGMEPIIQNLQSVVVTASREWQLRKDIPATVNSIPSETIRETNPTQLNQLLNKVPGLVMKDLNNEQHMMAIRQPMTSRPYFLYLEDGLPVAPVGNFNHNQLIEVNMLGIKTVEVMKGPASSIYGSNAVGGAINFITQSPTAVPTARVGYQHNTYGYQRVEFYGSNYMTKKIGLSLDGYMAKQRNGWQANSDFDKFSISAKGIFHISSKTNLTGYITANSLNTQTGGGIDSAGFYTRKYLANNNFAYRKVNSLRETLTLNHQWNEDNKTNVSLYFGQNSIGQNPRYRIKNVDKYTATGEENENSYANYGIVAQHTRSFHFLQSKLIGGIQSNYAPVTYWSKFGNILRDTVTGYYTNFSLTDSLLADYQTNLIGLGTYLQYEFTPVNRLKVVAGMRFDQLSYQYTNNLTSHAFSGVPDTTLTNYAVSPKVGLTYDLHHNSGLYANYSKGFSPPQTSDLFFGTKVPVLKPAYFTNYEAGGWTSLFDGKLYLDVSIYRMEGTDEIISFRLPDNSTESRNSGKTIHKGIEYNLTYRPVKDIFFRLGGTYAIHKYLEYSVQEKADGETISFDGNFMPEAPKVIHNAELTLKPHFIKGFRAALEWQYIGSWFKDDANLYKYDDRTFILKGASILNLRMAYKIKSIELYCNILNLTNELYANSVTRGSNNKDSFAAGAPRTFAFGFNFNFDSNDSSK